MAGYSQDRDSAGNQRFMGQWSFSYLSTRKANGIDRAIAELLHMNTIKHKEDNDVITFSNIEKLHAIFREFV